MRRTILAGMVVLTLLVGSLPALANPVVKMEVSWPCAVGWATDNAGLAAPDCEVENIKYDNGGYTLTLKGQIPADQLAAFQASGVTEFATQCWVNFLFVVQDGEDPIAVDSVRHFTADGEVTEHCHGLFSDTPDHTFESDIEWLAFEGITQGCNPPANSLFCPNDLVTRGQMSAFLHRALDDALFPTSPVDFTDDDGNTFEADIEWLGATGVTRGCNPPANDQFCPSDFVTRGQMAAFLVRALGYTDNGGGDLFVDDDGSTFEADIDKLGTAGVTKGCNPPANTAFCPDEFVTRGQMAAFLHRALES